MASATAPAGFTSMATVTGYQVQASAESGVGAAAPSASRAGSLSYWNGTGYTTVSLAGSPATPITLPAVTQTFSNDGHDVNITMSGQIDVGPVSATPSGALPCQPTACGVSASARGVVTTLTYSVVVDGVNVANFTAATDLGSALAGTTYRAAPSA